MSIFPTMSKVLLPQKRGIASIFHHEITELQASMSSMRGIPTVPGKVAVLTVKGQTMMSDSYNEQRSNRDVVWHSQGDVLIAGLGIGMILHPILKRPEVKSVTVIEKYQDVIDLVAPTVEPVALRHNKHLFT